MKGYRGLILGVGSAYAGAACVMASNGLEKFLAILFCLLMGLLAGAIDARERGQ